MELQDLFRYDPSSGNLIWMERPREHFTSDRSHKMWNTRYASKPAGCEKLRRCGAKEQIRVEVNGAPRSAHQIIWEMEIGPVPKGMMIDHKDGDPFNNKLDNLRIATNSQNGMNRKMPSNNTSGLKGATFNKASGKYIAQIKKDGKQIHLGYFATAEQAHAAYLAAGSELHGEFFRPG